MNDKKLKQILEAVLMASLQPLSVKDLAKVLVEDGRKQFDIKRIETALKALIDESATRPVELKKVASGYRYQTNVEFLPWIARLWEEKPPRYSRALLETLALIAYRQPITRLEIEEVRGVTVNSRMMGILEERGWIKIVGQKEVPGRPLLYATTKEFLDYFNLRSLEELPELVSNEQILRLHPELGSEPPDGGEKQADVPVQLSEAEGDVEDPVERGLAK